MDLSDLNALAGVAALVNSLLMAPSVAALRKIAKRHDGVLDEHEDRIEAVERKTRSKTRK